MRDNRCRAGCKTRDFGAQSVDVNGAFNQRASTQTESVRTLTEGPFLGMDV